MKKKEISYIISKRYKYSPLSTLGRVFLQEPFSEPDCFSYLLEDTVRAEGIKVFGFTAVPENLLGYKVAKTWSPKYKREMLLIYTNDEDMSLEAGGIRFTGVRNHGGNTHKDTNACFLTAYNLMTPDENGDFRIRGRSDKDLMEWYDKEIAKGHEVRWVVMNLKQKK